MEEHDSSEPATDNQRRYFRYLTHKASFTKAQASTAIDILKASEGSEVSG